MYLTFRSSRHVAHISGYLGYLPICLSVRPPVSLPHNASLPILQRIAYSVQRITYRYVPRRYVYLPSFSPHLFSPIPSLPSPLLSSSPSSSSFYSSTPSPTRRPEGFSRRGFFTATREDKGRYDSWAWLVLERRSVEGGIEVPLSCTVFEYWQE